MIRTLAAACAALLLLGAAQPWRRPRPVHPKLKPAATVTGGIVRIGDLVENAGVVANVPIFRSPDLGTTGTVSAEAVVDAVRAHALPGLDTEGLSEVSVTRAARTFRPEQIENMVARALAAKFALGAAKDVSLNLDSELTAAARGAERQGRAAHRAPELRRAQRPLFRAARHAERPRRRSTLRLAAAPPPRWKWRRWRCRSRAARH